MKTNLVKNVKAGFSLVEMLVVIAVIGIIAAIAVPTIGNITAQANASKAKRNAQNLASVCASAVAAGATFTSTTVADIVDDLVDTGVTGSAASGFDSTLFKVPNMSATEKTAAIAHLQRARTREDPESRLQELQQGLKALHLSDVEVLQLLVYQYLLFGTTAWAPPLEIMANHMCLVLESFEPKATREQPTRGKRGAGHGG